MRNHRRRYWPKLQWHRCRELRYQSKRHHEKASSRPRWALRSHLQIQFVIRKEGGKRGIIRYNTNIRNIAKNNGLTNCFLYRIRTGLFRVRGNAAYQHGESGRGAEGVASDLEQRPQRAAAITENPLHRPQNLLSRTRSPGILSSSTSCQARQWRSVGQGAKQWERGHISGPTIALCKSCFGLEDSLTQVVPPPLECAPDAYNSVEGSCSQAERFARHKALRFCVTPTRRNRAA